MSNYCCLMQGIFEGDAVFTTKKDVKGKYGVPTKLIPKTINYDEFNPLEVKKNRFVQLDIVMNKALVHIFKIKVFDTMDKAIAYAKKKGHEIVYNLGEDLRECRVS